MPSAEVLKTPLPALALPRPSAENKLPVVLSGDEVRRLLSAVGNPKHRTLLMLTYSAGVRVGEAVRLRPEDLDPERRILWVRQSKGRKDRQTLLSDTAWRAVELWLRIRPPSPWLFPGGRWGRHLYGLARIRSPLDALAADAPRDATPDARRYGGPKAELADVHARSEVRSMKRQPRQAAT